MQKWRKERLAKPNVLTVVGVASGDVMFLKTVIRIRCKCS